MDSTFINNHNNSNKSNIPGTLPGSILLCLFFIVIVFASNTVISALSNKTRALTVKPKSEFNIDTGLVKQADNFNLPNSIIVVPMTMPETLVIQDNEWYEGIFYYMTERLGQGDFLAHYFVTADGVVWQGNSKGDEQRFNFAAGLDKPIIIIYFSRADQTDFSVSAKQTLADLILDIANRNAIKLSSIRLRSLSYTLKKGEAITLKEDIVGGLWELSLKAITNQIAASYKPVLKNYSFTVEKVGLPESAVNYGDAIELALTIKNTSSAILYQGTDYEPLLSKPGKDPSKFFVNDTWLSQTQASFMGENTFLKPGESQIYKVKLNVPLYFGQLKEGFQLTNVLGQTYSGSNFDVTLNVNHPSKDVVEITATDTGQLNVRDGPSASSAVISRVTPGQRFFVLERSDFKTKLDLGNGKSGWVASEFTKKV